MAVAQSKTIGQTTSYTGNATLMGQVLRITPPAESFEKVEVTDLDDTLVAFIPSSPIQVGEVSIEVLWTPNADADAVIDTALRARSIVTHIITYNGLTVSANKIHTFSGFYLSVTPSVVEGKVPLTRTFVIVPTTVVTPSGA